MNQVPPKQTTRRYMPESLPELISWTEDGVLLPGMECSMCLVTNIDKVTCRQEVCVKCAELVALSS
jgi:hypothetical protein